MTRAISHAWRSQKMVQRLPMTILCILLVDIPRYLLWIDLDHHVHYISLQYKAAPASKEDNISLLPFKTAYNLLCLLCLHL